MNKPEMPAAAVALTVSGNRCGRVAMLVASLLISAGVDAVDVRVSGLFTQKALIQIDGGPLQTLTVGQTSREGVTLVSVDRDTATFEIGGKRVTLGMGHARVANSDPVRESTVLTADVRGHFYVDGQINGRPARFVVDTGATLISIPAGEARRLSIDYQKGQKAQMRTANGNAPGYLVKLDTVSVGGIAIYGVDAVVIEGNGLSSTLLGMSFLNRMNMKREGDVMTLTKRY
jgi:aspartyl protease family protein